MKKPKIELTLKAPMFPNFLRYEGNGDVTISIGALSDEELVEYAEYWKQLLNEA